MSTAETSTAAARSALKRPHSSSDDDDDAVCSKQRYFYMLAPESTDYSSDGPESIYSVQARSTDLAHDTSDTCSKDSWSRSDDSRMIELEVVSLPDSEAEFPSFLSSSAPEDLERLSSPTSERPVAGRSSQHSADVSDDDGGRTYKPRTTGPHLFCTLCKNVNSDSHFMYCVKCHRLKKNLQPDRPKRRRPKAGGGKVSPRPGTSREGEEEEEGYEDSSSLAQSSSADSLLRRLSPPTALASSSPLCHICLSRPPDAGFCHRNIIHVYSCYPCSVKTINLRGRCPVCNRKPKSVCKIIVT